MENASKALLMAAEVLIGLMVVSLAFFLFINFGQRAKDMQDEIQMNQITEFNNRFMQYVTDEPIATIYDVISVAKYAHEYNIKNEITEDKDMLKVYLDTERLDEVIYTNKNKQIELINEYTDRDTGMLEESTTENRVVFGENALFKCEIPEGDQYRDLSGRILYVKFLKNT